MGSSEGAPAPKAIDSNAAGAGPSFGMGWNAPTATSTPSPTMSGRQVAPVQLPAASQPSVGGAGSSGLNPATGYQRYTPQQISTVYKGTDLPGIRKGLEPVVPAMPHPIPVRESGAEPNVTPKRWTAPRTRLESPKAAATPKEPLQNPYGDSAGPAEPGRTKPSSNVLPNGDSASRPVKPQSPAQKVLRQDGAGPKAQTPSFGHSAEDQAALQREADAVAKVSRYDDYYDHARRALADGGEAAVPELREIVRLHSLAVGKSDPQAAQQFDAGINREIAAYRAQAAERQSEAGPNTTEAYTPAKIDLGNPGEYNPERYQKRKDEDFPTAQARIAGAIAQDQEAAEKRRFAEGADLYAAAQENAGVTITRAPDQDPVMDFGDGVRLDGLDTAGTKRLAEAIAEDPSVAEDIRSALSGDLTAEDIENRLAELGAFDQTSVGARRRSRNQGAIDRELALMDVVEGRASGASEAELAETLVNAYAPDREEDLALARDLLLDMLPIVGEIRSAQDAVTDFTAMTKAIEAGDWKLASQSGLFGVLAVAGAVPGFGKVAKLARTTLVRGLRTTAAGRRVVAGVRLAKFERQFPEKFKTFNTKDLIQGIPEADQRSVQLLLNMSMGDVTEKEVVQAMKDAGFDVVDERKYLAVGKKHDLADSARIYDAATPEGVDNLLGIFWRPDERKLGTAIEVKSGKARLGPSQKLNDIGTIKESAIIGSKEKSKFSVQNVRYLRVRLDQIDPKHLEGSLSKRLGDVVKKGKLSKEAADTILHRAMAYRAQSSKSNPVPLLALSAMIRAAIVSAQPE
ncbi:MAG: hypothetical protein P1V34_13850 [Alphaproteobacteria bacterium]|nr:hypothetical protein [Alphaproteobacteria bacterium]